MTDITSATGLESVSKEYAARSPRLSVQEAYWGYTIRTQNAPRLSILMLQAGAMLTGAACLAAAIGLQVLPQAIVAANDPLFKDVASVLFAAVAALLLWFASRGTTPELQVDTTLGEVREVVRNRAGKATLLGRYGFDAIGGVFLDRQVGPKNEATLVLRYQNTAQTLHVASGPIAPLEMLRDRLGRDLILSGRAAPIRAAA